MSRIFIYGKRKGFPTLAKYVITILTLLTFVPSSFQLMAPSLTMLSQWSRKVNSNSIAQYPFCVRSFAVYPEFIEIFCPLHSSSNDYNFSIMKSNLRSAMKGDISSQMPREVEVIEATSSQESKRRSKGSTPEFVIDGDSTEETPAQKLVVTSHFLLLFVNIFISFLTLSMVPFKIGSIIGIIVAVLSSVIVGDFATGVFHWSVDNYGDIKTPIFGKVCVAFQGHHVTPWTITFRSFANNVYKIAYGTIPALAVLALSPCTPHFRLFFSLFINWWLLSQEFHKYSHMRVVPRIVKLLQDRGVILPRKEHGSHHSSPFEGNYCIVNGMCNSFLDKTQFFRYLEKAVFDITGNKPNTWKEDPLIEEYCMRL